ncbi:MAG TPA: TonB-dependent receptor [Sphingomonas sp.]
MVASDGATAQTSPVAQAAPAENGDIVVTATRQSQLLSKVPISVSAYSQKSLDVQGIRNINDVARFTPGISIERNGFGTQANISIRGIDSNIGAGTVGIYVDDTPIQTRSIGYSSTNLYPQLFDLERVEVLRGPQGTLFGAGSEGGTIRFITPAPSLEEWHEYARAELGAIDGGGTSYEAGLAVGGPIIKDKLGFRVSVDYRRDGGWIDRVVTDPVAANAARPGFTSIAEKNANHQGALVARAALTFQPFEDLKITPSILYQNTRLHDVYTYWDAESDPSRNVYRNGQALRQPDHDKYTLPALKIEYNGPGFDVIANTSWFSRTHRAIDDYTNLIAGIYAGSNNVEAGPDGNPLFPGYRAYATMKNSYHNFTQELRVQSQDPQARFTWVVGGFYNNLRESAVEDIIDPDFGEIIQYAYGAPIDVVTGFGIIDGQYSLLADGTSRDRQIAGYGEISYRIVGGLRARAGLRVSRNKFDSHNFATGAFNFATTDDRGKTSETPVTPKFSLEWQADRNTLLYATAAKGFRVGGANPSIPVAACGADLDARGYGDGAPTTYASDSLWSYEGGAKSKLFGGRTQISASVFHIHWKNIQQNVYLSGCGLQFTDNLGAVNSNGFDLQVNQKLGALTLNVAVGYTRARFSGDIFAQPGDAVPRIRKGDAIEPRPWTVVAGGQYDFSLLGRKSYLRADYTFRGGHAKTRYEDEDTTSYDPTILESQTESAVNLRAGLLFGPLDLSAFATNLLDDHPRLTHYAEGTDPIFRETTLTPRTVGLTASYRY